MATKKQIAEFEVQFKGEGLGSIEKQLTSFIGKVPKMMKDVEFMGFGDISKQISDAERKLISATQKLSDLKERAFAGEEGFSEFDGIEGAKKFAFAFNEVAQEALSARSKIEGLYKTASYSQQGLAVTFRNNLKALKKYGGESSDVFEEAAAASSRLKKTLSSPEGEKYIRTLNSNLEKELSLLQKIKSANDTIGKLGGVNPELQGIAKKQISPLTRTLSSKSSSKVEVTEASKELSKLVRYYDALTVKQKDLDYNIEEMARKYKISATGVDSLKNELKQAVAESAKLGTKSPITTFSKSLGGLEAELKKLSATNVPVPPFFDQMKKALKALEGEIVRKIGKIPMLA
jgi:hypothetical protein